MKRMTAIGIALLCAASLLFAAAGSWKQLGKTGDWKGTIAGTGIEDVVVTVESSGALYITDAKTGEWKQIGKAEFANTVFLFATQDGILTIEKDGSLYAVNGEDGSWKQLGKAGDWKGTIAGAVLNGKLYTVESSGAFYVTDPNNGSWKQIGKAEFANTVFMFAAENTILTIEKDGSLYSVNPANGSWKQLGKSGDWKGTIAGATIGDTLYTVESSGAFYATDAATGEWKQLGKPEFANTVFMFAADGKILTIEKDGSLYAVQVE